MRGVNRNYLQGHSPDGEVIPSTELGEKGLELT